MCAQSVTGQPDSNATSTRYPSESQWQQGRRCIEATRISDRSVKNKRSDIQRDILGAAH
jgi:hypothetical protein